MRQKILSSAAHQTVVVLFSRYVISDDALPVGFGRNIGSRIRVTRLRASLGAERPWAEAVCELDVERDMLDCAEGVMHSACAAYLIDMCTALPYISLWVAQAEDAKGKGTSPFAMAPFAPSQRLDIVYYHSACLGARLRVIGESLASFGPLLIVRGEIWDIGKDRLIASGVHTKVMPKKPPLAAKGKL